DDGDVKLSLWNADGELLRTVRGEFLAGPIAVSANRTTFVAPVGNRVTLRDTSSGEPIGSITISDDKYCSATAACFVRGQSLILIAAAVSNNKGHTFGQLSVADYEKREVLYDAPLDMHPLCIAVDVQFRWACIAGKRRGRGYIQFLD